MALESSESVDLGDSDELEESNEHDESDVCGSSSTPCPCP